MYGRIIFFIVLYVLNFDSSVSQYTRVNEICETNSGEIGTCLHLNKCATAKELIKKKGHPKICSFDGKYPIVCCEENENLISKRNSFGKVSKQKCTEYKITSITTTTTTTPLPPGTFVAAGVGGYDTDPLEFPHMAILGYNVDNKTKWLCGGSLISENFVMTAAHCINTRYGRVQQINLGVHQISYLTADYLQSFRVKNIFIHPNYTNQQHYNDIALIELDGKANIQSGVKPACLHTTKELPTDSFVATGWGATELYGDNSDILQKVFLKFVTYSNCSQYYKSQKKLPNGLLDESQLCADGGTERADTCQGDSGGPLQIKNEDDELHIVVGITSLGIKCAIVPAIYTRVSYYIPWIESIVWPNSQ